MRATTLSFLKCPGCNSDALTCSEKSEEITTGSVNCKKCSAQYPILAGVLVLVEDVGSYLLEHVKGISRYVSDQEIPKKFRSDFLEAKSEIESEHIEEDLEAERVTALYIMTHYLHANEVSSPDPLLNELIKKHWDNGPFSKIKEFVSKRKKESLVELGCGVGGLYVALQDHLHSYLGLDSSFASIALARHFALGTPLKQHRTLVPHDLLQGSISREVKIPPAKKTTNADFIVCDLAAPPIQSGLWQLSAALNVIDMLPEPKKLPELQHEILERNGIAIQSCPYIWHPDVAAHLRETLPSKITDSANAAEYLYSQSGFRVENSTGHVPWIFFKNIRQLEIYSVHLFYASKM